MRAKLLAALITLITASGFAVATHAIAVDGPTFCQGRRLAADALNDDTYAGQDGTPAEAGSGDIEWVQSSLGVYGTEASIAYVTVKVRDLAPTGPHHFDLRLIADLVTDTGETITVDARRSVALGATATVDGSSDGVTVQFLEDRDLIKVKAPAAAFAGARSITLAVAETRYDSGAGLSPLADDVTGACVMRIDPSYVIPAPDALADLPASVLVIDSGVNGRHPEFGNLFAWWDFSGHSADPDPFDNDGNQTWMDTDGDGVLVGDTDDPYDPDGHGSATSSMAAGLNTNAAKTPSACPGCALAVAKVFNEDIGEYDGDLPGAIRWGVDTVGVDTINISLGSLVPLPAVLLPQTYEAVRYAHSRGVSVVFANGNGWGNAGVPGQPGGLMPFGNSPFAVSVGAEDTIFRYLVTTDPEVVATFSVHAAAGEGDSYQDISGTSFGSPYVAGWLARVIGEARSCGSDHDLSPDSVERLLKFTAKDRVEIPPTVEGYGLVDNDTLQTALGVVCRGEALPTPDPTTDFYVANVSGTQRSTVGNHEAGIAMTETGMTGVSGPLTLASSLPSGAFDAEVFQTTVAPGATLAVVAEGQGPLTDVQDFDMALFAGTGPEYRAELASSGEEGSVREALSWTNTAPEPVTVSLVVYGWLIGDQVSFTLTGIDPATRVFDGYLIGHNLI